MTGAEVARRLHDARAAATTRLEIGDVEGANAIADAAMLEVFGLEGPPFRSPLPAVPWLFEAWREINTDIGTTLAAAPSPTVDPTWLLSEVRVLATVALAAVTAAGLRDIPIEDWPFPERYPGMPPRRTPYDPVGPTERALRFFEAVTRGELPYPEPPGDLLPPVPENGRSRPP